MLNLTDFHPYQHAAVDHMNQGADSYLLAGPGSGKTAAISTSLVNKKLNDGLRRTLIVAPPRVARTVWPTEPAEWSHLSSDLTILKADGGPNARRELIDSGDGDAVTLSYENLAWFFENYHDARQHPFDGVVFDEIDMMCNPSSQRFKKFKRYVKHFDARIGATATYMATGLQNIWAQMYLLDEGEALGRSYDRFLRTHFYALDFEQRNWEPHDFAENRILERIKLITHRVNAADSARNPPIERDVNLEAGGIFDRLDRALRDRRKQGFTYEGVTVSADTAALVGAKRLQLAAGFFYGLDERGERRAVWFDYDVFDALDNIIRQHPDEQILIMYSFKAQADVLSQRFPGIPLEITDRVIRDWNACKIPLAAAHPASMSHGINMQKGGARIIVYLTPPWTYRRYLQVNGRLNRQGNPYDDILVYRIIRERSGAVDALASLQYREGRDGQISEQLERVCDHDY